MRIEGVTPVEKLGMEIANSVECWPPALRKAWEAAHRAEKRRK